MTGAERGFLLLTSHLGDPERKPLSTAQFRQLARRMEGRGFSREDRLLEMADLTALGYSTQGAERILALLSQEELLKHYLSRGSRAGCVPVTRVSGAYPLLLRQRLGLDSPGCLWAKGNLHLLALPGIALVGSRDLNPANEAFAREVGRQAALQGLVLISGNARGADRNAQEACLAAGGRVISIVADALFRHVPEENMLYLSEEAWEASFSAQRALSRNRAIHALGRIVFVAQARQGKGGTWDGAVKNLRQGWSNVACFRDGSAASLELEQMGAFLLDREDLMDMTALAQREPSLF